MADKVTTIEPLTSEAIFTDPLLSRPYPIAARAALQVVTGGPVAAQTELQRTDAAMARDFAGAVDGRFVYDHTIGRWRYFDPPIWRVDVNGRALHQLQENAEQKAIEAVSAERRDQDGLKAALRQLGARTLKNVLDLAAVQPGIAMVGDEFDRDPWLYPVQNGAIELREMRFRMATPGDYLSLVSAVAYDADATCPRFLGFLNETLDDPEIVAFMKRFVGYCLTGLTSEQVFLCLLGNGANGKGTLTRALQHVFGTLAVTLPFASFTGSKANGGGATPDLVRLPGRRLMFASETRVSAKFDESILKSLTGQDSITARALYGQQFEFTPVCKLVFSFNDRPKVRDLSHAFWRRALLVQFKRQFLEHERDPHLDDKLRAEGSGILNWALEGCREWQAIGLQPPAAVRSAVDEWRQENDVLAEFIGHGCEPSRGTWVHARELYAGFVRWCEAERVDEHDRLGRKAFTGRMRDMAEAVRRGDGLGFVGLKPRL